MLLPVVALVGWTLVMQIWMYATRLPAMRRKGIDLKGRRGGRGGQLDGVLEDEVQWKAHNYNHLLEQPTLFYAIAITLALAGGGRMLEPLAGLGLCRPARAAQPDPGDEQYREVALPRLHASPRSCCWP